MFHFPYLGTPFFGRYSRYGYKYPYYTYGANYSKYNLSSTPIYNKNNNMNNLNKSYPSKEDIPKKNIDINKSNDNNSTKENPCFSLFGINLYFDDILLIFLIWFLYDEGVKDEGLFIALILLLLS